MQVTIITPWLGSQIQREVDILFNENQLSRGQILFHQVSEFKKMWIQLSIQLYIYILYIV